MKTEHGEYTAYSNENISHGIKLDISRSVYYNGNCNISDLIKQPIVDVGAMKEKNIEKENAAYEKVLQAVDEWEKVAIVTQRYKRALEYLNVPTVSHTSNKWFDKNNGFKERSNMVYVMEYRIHERSNKAGTSKWDVTWSVKTQRPYNQSVLAIGGQERTFSTKERAEKYMQGRIKVYDNLFTEISPVIPDIYEYMFSVNGELLPGYTTVSMQKELDEKAAQKPSVKNQLNELKSQSKEKSKPEPAKKRNEIAFE